MKRFLVFFFAISIFIGGLPINGYGAEPSKLDRHTEQFLQTMDEQQKKQFADIKMGHGVVRAVEYTNKSIDRAIKSCGKNNPSLKPELISVHKSWKANLLPTLRKGEDRVDQMIKRQRIAKPLVIRSYLKEYDMAAVAKNKKIKEVPITSVEECRGLMGKMKSVENELMSLITDTLKLNQEF
jgi:hypothetical protein